MKIKIRSLLRMRSGEFIALEEIHAPPVDPEHIEGAIELRINGVDLITIEHWDYVDQLWAYIVRLIRDIKSERTVRTGFPDQPMFLSFDREGVPSGILRVVVEADDYRCAVAVDEVEFLSQLTWYAREFFRRLTALVPANRAPYDAVLAWLT